MKKTIFAACLAFCLLSTGCGSVTNNETETSSSVTTEAATEATETSAEAETEITETTAEETADVTTQTEANAEVPHQGIHLTFLCSTGRHNNAASAAFFAEK